ncbi:hypothetical protein EOA22_20640 [Mesorhizobium sp. M7A.F.Ca.US.014.04.1.1]|uniref:hypothetical protein n=1 Tax=Mesorhizobium TaxID=68287 RepID=UPI0007A952F5|nr:MULTISPECIES: hypothetical protein [Mesorhizobium]AMX93577.1 hypothetical protein A4R28_10970 [Mesorhizobium ciceri]MDF3208269.1 hypothetical protein [Mesorhizobium sp. LMG15046]MDF3229159.1 hypothetical protein [Mesorhizobium sp. DSM 30133]RUU22266.1 hypothetical protein EOC84_03910 [Mesorhizobium sp. Primo-B]RUU37825.1 hypothetical protein EOC83_16305 [Mesorhizobium sp. Primo-A]
MDLEEETVELTKLLSGKMVIHVWRFRAAEVLIEFTDGTRLFVDARSDAIECSVTDGISD